MARPYRIQFNGARYLVSASGLPRRKLFRNAEDFDRMVGMIQESAEKLGVLVHAFCLDHNRVELVVETPRGNLSKFQQVYKTGYTSYFRKKYGVSGKLFQDRFKAKVMMVEGGESLLLLVSRHVHLLPARAAKFKGVTPSGKVKAACAWKWSSLPGMLQPKKSLDFVSDAVLKAVGGRVTERPKRLRAFLGENFAARDAAFEMVDAQSRIAIGEEDFINFLATQHAKYVSGRKPSDWNAYGKAPRKKVSRKQIEDAVCKTLGKSKAEVTTRRKGSLDRPLLSWALYEYGGMTQDAIAEYLGLSAGATVSQHSRRVREAEKTDKKFAKTVGKVRSKLG